MKDKKDGQDDRKTYSLAELVAYLESLDEKPAPKAGALAEQIKIGTDFDEPVFDQTAKK